MSCINPNSKLNKFANSFGMSSPIMIQELLHKYEGVPDDVAISNLQDLILAVIIDGEKVSITPSIDANLASASSSIVGSVREFLSKTTKVNTILPEGSGIVYQLNGKDDNSDTGKAKFFTRGGFPISIDMIIKIKDNSKTLTLRDPVKSKAGSEIIQYLSGSVFGEGRGYEELIARFKSPFEHLEGGKMVPTPMTLNEYLAFKKTQPGFENITIGEVFKMFTGNEFDYVKEGVTRHSTPSLDRITNPDVKAWFTSPKTHKRIVYEISNVTNEEIARVATKDEMDTILDSQENNVPLKSSEVVNKSVLLQKAFPGANVEYQLTSQDLPGGSSEEHVVSILNELSRRFGIGYEIDNTMSAKGMFNFGTNIVTINPRLCTPDTMWHEYIHPFVNLLETNRPELFNALIAELKAERPSYIYNTEINYPNYVIDGKLTTEGYKEALVELLGRESMYAFSDAYEINSSGDVVEKTGGVSKLKDLIRRFYTLISDLFNRLINDPSIIIEADMLPVMTINSLAHIIGGTRNLVNIIGVESLSVPKEKQDIISNVVNKINKSLSGLIAITESRITKRVATGSLSEIKDLQTKLTKSKIMKGVLTSVYYSQSHYSEIIKKYNEDYKGMNLVQRMDFLRDLIAVTETFEPLSSMNSKLFEGISFANKGVFLRALASSNDLRGKVNSIIDSHIKDAYNDFAKDHQTREESARFSIMNELESAADVSMAERYVGAMASSPDFISALHKRIYNKTLKEGNDELKKDVSEFIEATEEIKKKGYSPEDILTDKDENGNNIPFMITDIDRSFYKKKEELISDVKDHRGVYLDYIDEDTEEAKEHNKNLKEKKDKLESFLGANTEIDPDVDVKVSMTNGQSLYVPLAKFKETVLGLNPYTGSVIVNPQFDISSVNRVFDEYFSGKTNVEVNRNGKVISTSSPFSYIEKVKFYNYDNFIVKAEYKTVKPGKYSNKHFLKLSENQEKLNYYNAYLNFVGKYKQMSPVYAQNKNMLPVMEKESVKGFFGAEDKSAYAENKFNQFKVETATNISAEQNSINGKNAPVLPMFFKSKFSEKKNKRISELSSLMKTETDEKALGKIHEEFNHLMTFVDYTDVDFGSIADSAINFAAMVHDNNNKMKIESASLIAAELLDRRQVYSKSLILNEPSRNINGEINYKTDGNRIAAQFREDLESQLYQLGDPDKGSTAEIIGTKITQLASYTGVAFNPKSSFYNLAMGHLNNLTESVGRLFYNTSHLMRAKAEFNSIAPGLGFFKKGEDRSPLKMIIDELEIFVPNSKEHRFSNMSQSAYSKLMISDIAFALDNFAEYSIQSQVIIAMMDSHAVDSDGSILSYSDFKKKYRNGTEEQFQQLPTLRSGVTTENGVVDYGVSQHELFLWKERVKGVIQITHGRYTKEDAAAISRYWWGKMLLQFKRWVGATVEERIVRSKYDTRLREDVEGRYRTFGKWVLSSLVKFKEAEAGAMDWKNLTEAQKGNIRKTGMDIAVIALTWSAVSILGNVLKDMGDDDEEGTAEYAAINFMRYSAMRIRQETSTLVNPFEWKSFTSNPMASMRTLTNLVDFTAEGVSAALSTDVDVYDRGDHKGEAKWIVKGEKVLPGIPFLDYLENLFKKPIDFYKQTK